MVRAESKHLSVHKQQQHISAVSLASKSHSVCGSRDEEDTKHPGAPSLHTDRPGSIGLTANLQWCEVEPARLRCLRVGGLVREPDVRGVHWGQNNTWPPLSTAHLCILKTDIACDPVTLSCYITSAQGSTNTQVGSKITCWQMESIIQQAEKL